MPSRCDRITVRLKADTTYDSLSSYVVSGFSRTVARYSGTVASAAAIIRTVALPCIPSHGSSRNPVAIEPPTAPTVLARYNTPARRPTERSARWTIALATGKARPISSAAHPTSSRIGRASNHTSENVRDSPEPTPDVAGTGPLVARMLRTSARNRPRSVNATNALCTIISQCAGLVVRRTSTPPTSDPTPMPIRMIVSSSENTARNPPNSKVKCRNHRISIPSAAKPDRPSARLVHMTASPPDRPPAAMSVPAGIIAAADGFRAEDALRLRESRDATAGAGEAVPGDAPRASASAPTPAITLSATATIWVAR